MTVFILWHIHHRADDDDEKLIGVYSSEQKAQSAITRLQDMPGFRDPDGEFEIHEYQLDKDGWTEGFVTIHHFEKP